MCVNVCMCVYVCALHGKEDNIFVSLHFVQFFCKYFAVLCDFAYFLLAFPICLLSIYVFIHFYIHVFSSAHLFLDEIPPFNSSVHHSILWCTSIHFFYLVVNNTATCLIYLSFFEFGVVLNVFFFLCCSLLLILSVLFEFNERREKEVHSRINNH